MFLFILESIGTSELILIGIVALIFLGPRKLPEMARKIGKMMAEFRGTASEFKETWQREVSFEEEAKAFSLNDLEAEPVALVEAGNAPDTGSPAAPTIKEIDPVGFQHMIPAESDAEEKTQTTEITPENNKKNWL